MFCYFQVILEQTAQGQGISVSEYTEITQQKHWIHPYLDCPNPEQKLPGGSLSPLSLS